MKQQLDQKLTQFTDRLEAPGWHVLGQLHGKSIEIYCGTRADGSEISIAKDDLWHIGSCGKAITASLSLELHNQKLIPQNLGLKPGIGLMDLLTHSSGIQDVYPAEIWGDIFDSQADPRVLREQILDYWLNSSVEGSKSFQYSNWNYILVGALVEREMGQSFESLVQTYITGPLKMDSLSWAPPDGRGDNPGFFAPAGTMSMTMRDWENFIKKELKAVTSAKGKTQAAQVNDKTQYLASGWMRTEGKAGPIYFHSGSNTMWYAQATLLPQADSYCLVAANADSPGIRRVVGELAGYFNVAQV